MDNVPGLVQFHSFKTIKTKMRCKYLLCSRASLDQTLLRLKNKTSTILFMVFKWGADAVRR